MGEMTGYRTVIAVSFLGCILGIEVLRNWRQKGLSQPTHMRVAWGGLVRLLPKLSFLRSPRNCGKFSLLSER